MKTLWQIFAIARSEFRFGLRRGAPVVMTAVVGLLLGAGILMSTGSNIQNIDVRMQQFTPDQVAQLAKNGITPEVWRSLSVGGYADLVAMDSAGAWGYIYLALLLLPIATAGFIPADRQFGVFELLRSIPINGSTYLTGKLLGGIGLVVFIACFPFLLFLAVLEGIMLKFIGFGIPSSLILLLLKVSLTDGLAILACATALGILAGVAFRTRRTAILPGIITGLLGIFAWLSAFRYPGTSPTGLDVAAYFIFQKYQSLWQVLFDRLVKPVSPSSFDFSLVGIGQPAAGIAQVFVMYLVVLVIFASLFALARLWLKHMENF
jgi:ABC-type transport system involved in multi-copper enzyme maturation permease subunit